MDYTPPKSNAADEARRRAPNLLAAPLLLIGGLCAACPSNDESPSREETDDSVSVVQTREQAQAEIDEMVRLVRDYSYEQKEQFLADMDKELATIQARLDRLSHEVETSRQDAKAEATRKLEATRERWAHAKIRLDAAKTADATTWDDVKRDFADAYDKLEDSVEDSRRWLSEEIAP